MKSPGRTAGTAAVLVALRLFGAACAFATQALLARWLGAAALGHFFLVTAAIGILAATLPLGFQAIAQYFVAEYDDPARRGLQRGFLRTAYCTLAGTTLLAAIAGLVFWAAAPESLSPSLRAGTLLVALGAPAAALIGLNCGVGIALGRPHLALAPDLVLKPTGTLAAALVLGAAGLLSVEALVTVLCLILWAAAIAQSASLRAELGRRGTLAATPARESARWWRFAPAWLVILLVAELTIDLDLLLIARLLSPEELAVFGAAARIFVLASFALTAIYALLLPGVFAAGRTDPQNFAAAISRANVAATAAAGCCLLGALILGPFALALFGQEFAAAQPALLILVGSLLLRAALGPGSVVLSVHERPYSALPALFAGLALLVVLNVLLVPAYGITGAALALASAMTAWSLCQWLTAWRLTGQSIALKPRDFASVIAWLSSGAVANPAPRAAPGSPPAAGAARAT